MLIKSNKVKLHLSVNLGLCLGALTAILWVDRPLTLWVHQMGIDQWLILRNLTEGLPPVATFAVVVALVWRSWCSTIKSKLQRLSVGLLSSVYFYLLLKLTMQIKTSLKVVFGRYWPKTWIANNLSLIHDNVFGFNWWHGFGNQGSFPSGHSTYIGFCCVWLCYAQPRLNYVWITGLILMPLGLIALDYHFLGDCLAGISLGYTLGLVSVLGLGYSSKIFAKIYQVKRN